MFEVAIGATIFLNRGLSMKSLVLMTLLTLAGGLNASCCKSTVVVPVDVSAVLQPTKFEKRGNDYWDFHPSRGWKIMGRVQFYDVLKNKKMKQTTGADGRPIYKIGEIEVNQESFKWAADRRKEYKKENGCCTIS
jgi:hypothetical protein